MSNKLNNNQKNEMAATILAAIMMRPAAEGYPNLFVNKGVNEVYVSHIAGKDLMFFPLDRDLTEEEILLMNVSLHAYAKNLDEKYAKKVGRKPSKDVKILDVFTKVNEVEPKCLALTQFNKKSLMNCAKDLKGNSIAIVKRAFEIVNEKFPVLQETREG